MTDSRAALEARAAKFAMKLWKPGMERVSEQESFEVLADFAEQESSSLKLLLSQVLLGNVEVRLSKGAAYLWIVEQAHPFPVELDSSGIPVLTEEILKALEAAK